MHYSEICGVGFFKIIIWKDNFKPRLATLALRVCMLFLLKWLFHTYSGILLKKSFSYNFTVVNCWEKLSQRETFMQCIYFSQNYVTEQNDSYEPSQI